ncbi:MAG: glycosyltransferase family 2 protein [Pseudomonadota bacterium]
MSDRYCLVVPHYRHEEPLAAILPQLVELVSHVFIVDDHSGEASLGVLRAAAAPHAQVQLLARPHNGGKGAAMISGLRAAHAAGFSHALSIDADGQHRLQDLPALQRLSVRHPDALITGSPRFGADIPASRLHGRKLTNGLVKLETGARDFPDAMCGFRAYPLQQVLPLLDTIGYRTRMEFDVEILVRAHWAGLAVLDMPTPVSYPLDGRSHFNLMGDNVRLTAMHTLLLFGALWRMPRRLRLRDDPA